MKIVQQPTPPTQRLGDCEPGDVVRRGGFLHLVTSRWEGPEFRYMASLVRGECSTWDANCHVEPVDCELRIL